MTTKTVKHILAVLTAAATAFGLMAVYLHFAELKASYRKFKKWELEERNSYE